MDTSRAALCLLLALVILHAEDPTSVTADGSCSRPDLCVLVHLILLSSSTFLFWSDKITQVTVDRCVVNMCSVCKLVREARGVQVQGAQHTLLQRVELQGGVLDGGEAVPRPRAGTQVHQGRLEGKVLLRLLREAPGARLK